MGSQVDPSVHPPWKAKRKSQPQTRRLGLALHQLKTVLNYIIFRNKKR